MRKIILTTLILGVFTFTSCGSDDEATPLVTPTATACDIATTTANTAANALPATTSMNYTTKCNEYKVALQNKITECGDSNGNIQTIIDGLGDCSMTVIPKTYNDDIAPIIMSNCLNCHGATPSNGAPSSFNTYNLVKTGVQSGNILNRINNTTNPMPPNGLMSQSNRDIIQQWLDDGLLEN